MSGGEVGAKAGKLTIMVGGSQDTFDTVKPLFDLMGGNITLVGGNGDGQTTKVANQIIVALTIEAVGEALLFASKGRSQSGQGARGAHGRIRLVEDSRDPRRAHDQARTFDPGFRINLHQKDLNLALTGARALGLSLPNTRPRARSSSTVVPRTAGSAWDHSGMVKALEMLGSHEIGQGS